VQDTVATYASREGAPARYLDTLEQMMKSQAYRELAAALLFGDGLKHVPSLKWLKFMTWHIREEMEHYEMVVRMYRDFAGESVEPWVHERLAGKPLPMSGSWFELGMAQFLYDRGGFWQLKEYEECSFLPYRQVVQKIVSEERGHQDLGERIVVELCADPRNADVRQPLFEKWLRIGMLSFGRPETEGNRYAVSVGLKKRDSGAVMQDFLDDIKPAVVACGLRFPDPATLAMDLPPGLDWSLPTK
jgi:1,2-phenylacetyl-CoA epoxidase catalytic subunit